MAALGVLSPSKTKRDALHLRRQVKEQQYEVADEDEINELMIQIDSPSLGITALANPLPYRILKYAVTLDVITKCRWEVNGQH